MAKPTIKIFDIETQEEIEREMTDEEFAAWKLGNDNHAAKIAAYEAKRAEAEAKLKALGLSVDDLKVLGLA